MTAIRALPAAPELEMLPAPAQGQGESPMVILQKLHRLMRGRYWIAAPLVLLGAIAGGLSGYFATTPKYESVGAVVIQSMIPIKVFNTPETGPMAMFSAYVHRHANYLQDERVIRAAVNSKAWKDLGRSLDPDAEYKFEKNLTILCDPRESEWIRVKFQDPDPVAAKAAVDEVLNAYEDQFAKYELLVSPAIMSDLDSKSRSLEAEIQARQDKISQILRQNRTTDLDLMSKSQLQAIAQIDDQLNQYTFRIQNTQSAQEAQKKDPQRQDLSSGVTEAQMAAIERVDDQMRAYIGQRLSAQSRLDDVLAKVSPQHPTALQMQHALNNLNARMREYAQGWLNAHGGVVPGDDGAVATVSPESVANLKALVEELKTRREKLQAEAMNVNDARLVVKGLEDEIKQKKDLLDQFRYRLTQLTTESPMDNSGSAGRIRIMPPMSVPSHPTIDPRKKLAAAGFVLGGGLPLGLFLLWGLLDRRYRYSDDAGTGRLHPTLLGILPYLPGDLQDPEQAAVAAHCVHQIRTLLQISGAHHDRRVFAITSPTSGDGKTSLTLSLGLSFAAAGSETCLVDLDMIGGGLSSSMQAKSDAGLMHALDTGELSAHIRPTAYPRLSILPVGRDDAQEVSRLSPELVQRVIEEAKRRFDVVIIDTGPILGSIEASLVAAAADGVILAIGRGQGRAQADKAMEHLANVGATLIGVVFNRADPNDFRRAVSSASVRSVPGQNGHARPVSRRALPAMGPMASTVATQMGPSDNGTHDRDEG